MSEKITAPDNAELINSLEKTPAGRLLKIFLDFKKDDKEGTLTLGTLKEKYLAQGNEGFAEAVFDLMQKNMISIGRSHWLELGQIETLPDNLLVEDDGATSA